MTHKNKTKSFWEKLAHQHISHPEHSESKQDSNSLALLSLAETSQLKKVTHSTYLLAGLAGALGVILLYLPYHLYGSTLFPLYSISLPFLETEIQLEVSFLIYSAVLVLLEIWYLTYVNIKAVAKISNICGHPDTNKLEYQSHLDSLIAVSIEKKQKRLQSLGINPFQGLSSSALFLFQTLLKLKAALSNFFFTLLIKKIMGRYALRQIIDFAGIPIYAFWNVWGAKKVMDEARIRVLAPPLINRCVQLTFSEQQSNPEFIHHLFDTLQLISETKRAFHYNHFLLSSLLLKKFAVSINEEPAYNDNFINEIPFLSHETQSAIEKILIFGIMIDGKISYPEKQALKKLIANKIIKQADTDIHLWTKNYFQGKGMPELFKLFS